MCEFIILNKEDYVLKNKTFMAAVHETDYMNMSSIYAAKGSSDGKQFSRVFLMKHLRHPLRMMEGLLFR